MATAISAEKRIKITEYCFRIICISDISIQDFAKLIIRFGDQCEGFIAWINNSQNSLEISEDSLTVSCYDASVVCGQFDAAKGGRYHWQIKVSGESKDVNLGIVPIEFCQKSSSTSYAFWRYKDAYSFYFGDATIWHDGIQIFDGG